jgi:NDP-sugar pyrophosphorylase family protein
MNIIIPMAGLSSRFIKEGYTLPKYMLYAGNRSVFNIAVSSFEKYFLTANFIFVARNIFDTEQFIDEECKLLRIEKFQVIILDQPTKGQAETVQIGVEKSGIENDEAILIFNIDTFRSKYTFPNNIEKWDGYLEVFKGEGANWSYAKTEGPNSTRVIETAEKVEISDNCSTGIYYFKTVKSFLDTYYICGKNIEEQFKESYVAPLYNKLISNGAEVHINVIKREEVIFCGVPQEYMDYLKKTSREQ